MKRKSRAIFSKMGKYRKHEEPKWRKILKGNFRAWAVVETYYRDGTPTIDIFSELVRSLPHDEACGNVGDFHTATTWFYNYLDAANYVWEWETNGTGGQIERELAMMSM